MYIYKYINIYICMYIYIFTHMCFFMSAFILMFLSLILCESYNRILCVVYQYISILSGFPTDPVESWGSQQLLVLEVKWLLAPGEMARSSLG